MVCWLEQAVYTSYPLGGLLAQGLNSRQAVNLGVGLHSAAADHVAAESGERGLLATDLIAVIRVLLN